MRQRNPLMAHGLGLAARGRPRLLPRRFEAEAFPQRPLLALLDPRQHSAQCSGLDRSRPSLQRATVRNASARTTISTAMLSQCIARRVAGWRLPGQCSTPVVPDIRVSLTLAEGVSRAVPSAHAHDSRDGICWPGNRGHPRAAHVGV